MSIDCFVYLGEPTQLKVYKNSSSKFFGATIVCQNNLTGQIGFDCAEQGLLIAQELVRDGVHYDLNLNTLVRVPAEIIRFKNLLLRATSVSYVFYDEQICSRQLEIVHEFQKHENLNKLKKKFDVGVVPAEIPPILTIFNEESDLIDLAIADSTELGIRRIVKWKYSCFGLHCYLAAHNENAIKNLLSELESKIGFTTIYCADETEIPVH